MIKILLPLILISFVLGGFGGFQLRSNIAAASKQKQTEQALEGFKDYAQEVVDGMQADWTRVSGETAEALSDAARQREDDAQLEKEALVAIREVKNEISRVSKQLRVVENVGACRLGTDFIRLRNEAIEAANAGSPSG